MVYGEHDGDSDDPFSGSHKEHIAGYIGLDDQFNLARDENRKVILGPWHYVDPWP